MLSPRQRSTIATTLSVLGIILLPFALYALVEGYFVLIAASLGLIVAGVLVGKSGKRAS
jgi:hypothetical protein